MFSVPTDLPYPDVTYKWNHVVCILFYLASLYYTFENHPRCCMYRWLHVVICISTHSFTSFSSISSQRYQNVFIYLPGDVMNSWMVTKFIIITKTVWNIYTNMWEGVCVFIRVFANGISGSYGMEKMHFLMINDVDIFHVLLGHLFEWGSRSYIVSSFFLV